MHIEGVLYEEIVAALLDAFDIDTFAHMLRAHLGTGVRLDAVAPPKANFTMIVRATVDWAQREECVEELVAAAKRANPHNRRLQALPDNYIDVAPPTAAHVNWQPVVDTLLPLLLPHVWSKQDRQALLVDAFYTTRRREMYAIQLDGDAHAFATHCLRTIIDMDAGMLLPLVDALTERYGTADQASLTAIRRDIQILLSGRQTATYVGGAQPALVLTFTPQAAQFAHTLRENLARHGHYCHASVAHAKGSDAWLAQTAHDVSWSQAVIAAIGADGWDDRWLKVELLAACDKRKPIIIINTGSQNDAPLPGFLPPDSPLIAFGADPEAGFRTLLALLPTPQYAATPPMWTGLEPDLLRRVAEYDYMDRLKLAELQHVAHYTPLAGEARLRRTRAGRAALPLVAAGVEYAYRPWAQAHVEAVTEVQRFQDAIPQLKAIRQAMLLGEPGAGKTTTLYRLAADLIDAALLDRMAPIPLLVRLGNWKDPDESFDAFLQRSVGSLGADLPQRLKANRAALLLDGLNEIPADQHTQKYARLKAFLGSNRHVMAIVTCREHDYPAERDLGIDRVTVEPLAAPQIHAFIHAYLDAKMGREAAESLFWKLAGSAAEGWYTQFVNDVGQTLDEPLRTFWLDDQLPAGVSWGWFADNNSYWERWVRDREQPTSLLLLAANPYMLFMLLDVYEARGTLPANRGQLFAQFVERLLLREQLFAWDKATATLVRHPSGEALLAGLTQLAFAMQPRRVRLVEGVDYE